MRKYCVSTLPFNAFALDGFLNHLAENEITTIELASQHFQDLDAQTAAELQAETGVRFKSLLSTNNIAGPNGLDELVDVLNIAQKLSIPMVSVSSGGREDATEAEIETIIDRLAALTQEAERRNLMLSFYAHEGSMGYNLQRAERILNAISSNHFGFYYSPYHFHKAGDHPIVALERLAERLCNIYFNCGVDAATGQEPFWAPEMDFQAICEAIQRTGYSDEIMIIYLGLKVETPEPIVKGIVNARSLLNEWLKS